MLGEEIRTSEQQNEGSSSYDPFARGIHPVGVRTFEQLDAARNRRFPCEIWYPATAQYTEQDLAPETQDSFAPRNSPKLRRQEAVRDAAASPGMYPLILYSHHSGGHRRAATFLCTHLASHGYVVAALDHSEVVAPELARQVGESDPQKHARWDAVIASRVPDVQFLLGQVLDGSIRPAEVQIDEAHIGIAGHSFGAWTALTFPESEPRIRAIVGHAPGGTSNPRPGILPVKLNFRWGRNLPTMYLVAENDVSLPLEGMYETFARTPSTKRMFVLRRADHMHFVDNIEELHEAARQMSWPPELAWIQKEMRPISELCPGATAQRFVRALTLAHFDAVLKESEAGPEFLLRDVEAELRRRGVEAFEHRG